MVVCFRPSDICPLMGKTFEQLHVVCEEKLLRLQSEHRVKVIVMRAHMGGDERIPPGVEGISSEM